MIWAFVAWVLLVAFAIADPFEFHEWFVETRLGRCCAHVWDRLTGLWR